MNIAQPPPSQKTITIDFTGQIVLGRAASQELLHLTPAAAPPPPRAASGFEKVDGHGRVPRHAYTMKETAEILGVSYITVHRLLKRGLLRSCVALRTKIIARTEIERFLNTTTAGV